MERTQLIQIAVIGLLVLAGTTGLASAQPGEGPPGDLPTPVPDFVTDLLETISGFIASVLSVVGGIVETVTADTPAGNSVAL